MNTDQYQICVPNSQNKGRYIVNRVLRILAVPTVAAGIFALSACGNGDSGNSMGGMDMSGTSSSTSSSPSAERNDADIAFATGMIPHHEQAVKMADMALQQASTAEVKDFATKIKAAQDPEIKTMSDWLKAWGKPVPTGMSGMGSMDGMSMDGMMTDQEMTDLGKATDVAFDRMWLTMMIKHHQGAVKMAETEVQSGKNTDAKKLAQTIITAQTDEIGQMTTLLSNVKG